MRNVDIGLIGLGVMGENLALNMEQKGFSVVVYNRTADKVFHLVEGRGKGKQIYPADSLAQLVGCLSRPRKVMMMIKAGEPVDEMIEALIPIMEPGDIIIDGGNAQYLDTIRRTAYVEKKGLYYIGTGISGGEEGALNGPSIMPGGSAAAWKSVKPIFTAICAKTPEGKACCDWIGENGAGHFVKMVHNGIEYGDMQLICEVYQLMRDGLRMSAREIGEVFFSWNKGRLSSYLIEITAQILRYEDTDGTPLVDHILDCAGQKGTGKWTAISALQEGNPLTLITEAVFARCLSAKKKERVIASKRLTGPDPRFRGEKENFLADLEQALYAAKLISYAQGFSLLQDAAKTYCWHLDYGAIAMMWRGGCIIRSAFLDRIHDAYTRTPELRNLMLDGYFQDTLNDAQPGWRRVCANAILEGIPIPALSAALSYFDGYRTEKLPSNLLQAQRDYFGAHTYQRLDGEPGRPYHTNWTGQGGDTVSGVYQV